MASKGVDSVGPGFSDPANVVKMLARKRRRCRTDPDGPYDCDADACDIGAGAIVAMTGVDDWISDGDTVLKLSNGHHWVSRWRDVSTTAIHD